MNIVDMHCDTVLWSLMKELDPLEDPERQINRQKLLTGGALAQCFALFVPNSQKGSIAEQEEACYGLFQKLAESFRKMLQTHGGWLVQAASAAEILQNKEAGRVSAVLTLEDGTFVAGRQERLDEAAGLGARALALTWNTENCFGYPNSADAAAHRLPLKPFGREAVEHMNELGMLVDVSHLNEGGFWDVAAISKKPFVATHSCARSLVDHQRNLTDEQIKAIARAGGIIGVNFYPPFISKDGQTCSEQTVTEQVLYLLDKGGEDTVAFGSDFDGMAEGTLTFGDYSGYPSIKAALGKVLPERIVDKICYQNALRVLT